MCEISEYSEDERFLGVVDGGTKQWFTTVEVDGKPIEFCVDTGADVDVISEQVYQQFLQHKAVQPARKILKGASVRNRLRKVCVDEGRQVRANRSVCDSWCKLSA